MKKFAYVIAALAAAFAVSCTKETPLETPNTDAPAEVGMKEVTITASVEDVDTKTSYIVEEVDGKKVGKFSWTEGDQISVMDKQYKFHTLTATASGTSVTFSGMVPEGTELRQEAFFPADIATKREGSTYYFSIPEYKDLSKTGSADLPMGSYSGTEEYKFKHMSGAAYLTFSNFPDEIVAANISIVNKSLKISGVYKASLDEGLWYYGVYAAENESEKTFTRKVPVKDNKAELYLPYSYKGDMYAESNINIIGYDASGNEYEILKDKKMRGNGTPFERGQVIPYKTLELPTPEVNWEKVNWDSESVQTATLEDWFVADPTGSKYCQLTELKTIADGFYVYARIKAPVAKLTANQFKFYFADTNGGSNSVWYWEDTLYSSHYASYAGTIDAEHNIDIQYNGQDISFVKEVIGDDLYWYIALPRAAHELTKADGVINFGVLVMTDWSENGILPQAYTEMMKVTLP